ncbi:MAG TPA: hypothetical protein VE914_18820 [Candidatus Angelobacter sp.]|nr:hypothetical protein [Candidatus Angelobacter sp.]
MWTERQWRDQCISNREVVWSWVIVALIVVSLAAWAGVEALIANSAAPVAMRADG